MENITLDDLLQYLYKETSPEKTEAIAKALENDYSLQEKLKVMSAASKRLDALKMSPRQDTIDKIMQHAEKNIEELSH